MMVEAPALVGKITDEVFSGENKYLDTLNLEVSNKKWKCHFYWR